MPIVGKTITLTSQSMEGFSMPRLCTMRDKVRTYSCFMKTDNVFHELPFGNNLQRQLPSLPKIGGDLQSGQSVAVTSQFRNSDVMQCVGWSNVGCGHIFSVTSPTGTRVITKHHKT